MDAGESRSVLEEKHCRPCGGETPPLGAAEVALLLRQLDGWEVEGHGIGKSYQFKNFHQTMAFVNAVAWVAHREGHHPDLQVGFNCCRVSYTTHAVGGLSENDFICAARVDALLGK